MMSYPIIGAVGSKSSCELLISTSIPRCRRIYSLCKQHKIDNIQYNFSSYKIVLYVDITS